VSDRAASSSQCAIASAYPVTGGSLDHAVADATLDLATTCDLGSYPSIYGTLELCTGSTLAWTAPGAGRPGRGLAPEVGYFLYAAGVLAQHDPALATRYARR
jgi:hypothetical protein